MNLTVLAIIGGSRLRSWAMYVFSLPGNSYTYRVAQKVTCIIIAMPLFTAYQIS